MVQYDTNMAVQRPSSRQGLKQSKYLVVIVWTRKHDHNARHMKVVACITKAPVLRMCRVVRIDSILNNLLSETSKLVCFVQREQRIELQSNKSPAAEWRSQTFTVVVENIESALVFAGEHIYVAYQFEIQLAS